MARKETKNIHVDKESTAPASTFVDHVINVRRVTKVTKGGKRFSFSAFVVSGNKQGQVGIAIGKSKEATSAIAKATTKARKNMITLSLRGVTVPYEVIGKHGAAKVVLLPASKGTGKIAGSAVRAIVDAAGIEDVLTKTLSKASSINVAKATLNALAKLRPVTQLAKLRGKTVKELVKGA